MNAMDDTTGVRTVTDDARRFVMDLLDDLGPDLARRAGAHDAEVKPDGSLVTDADVESNERIVAAVAERFPGHGMVSEELGATYDGDEWTWIVDPIDGTTNFVRGVPYWCVSIALAFQGEPVVACVDAPARGERYLAWRGGGAWVGDRLLHVRDEDWDGPRVKHALLAVSSGVGKSYVLDLPLRPRAFGAAALNLCVVASGVAVATLQNSPKLWDVAAGWLLVEEAGGVNVPVDSEPPFPLEVGTDYADRSFRFVAAASEETARRVIEGIRARDGSDAYTIPGD